MKRNTLQINLEIMLYPFRRFDSNYDKLVNDCRDNKLDSSYHKTHKYITQEKEFTRTVWKNIGLYSQVRSLDEIKLLMKKHYPFIFDNKQHEELDIYREYQKIWDKLSKSLIAHRDGKIVFKYWKNKVDNDCFGPYSEYDKIQIYQHMSRMIPMDLLVCNYLLMNDMGEAEQLKGYYSHIMLADKQLENVLKKGLSENHLHAGASIPFSVSWTYMMNCFLEHRLETSTKVWKEIFGDELGSTTYDILYACILRVLMGIFLCSDKGNEKFLTWVSDNVLREDVSNFKLVLCGEKTRKEWIDGYSVICDGDNEIPSAFVTIWDKIFQGTNKITRNELSIDYMLDLFALDESTDTYGENIFILEALKYWRNGENDSGFFRLFLEYIKIKNIIFSESVQYGQMKGLEYFKHYYHITSKLAQKSIMDSETYWDTALREIFQTPFLEKVEIRIGPGNLKKRIQQILRAYQKICKSNRQNCPQLGIVVHFIKMEDEEVEGKCWKEYQDGIERTDNKIMYGSLQKKYKKEMQEILDLRKEIPYLSEVLLGIDTASGENDTPVCVFAPIFEDARDSKSQKLFEVDENGSIIQNKSLCFTFHAGEDFRHMISGLRRIDEVIEECKFHSGDRIGHGTVLGIEAKDWMQNNPVVILPRGEYLENLLWAWGKYREVQQYDASLILYLEEQILSCAEEIFRVMEGIQVSVLYQAYKKRFLYFKKNSKYDEDYCNENAEIFCCRVEEQHVKTWNAEKLVYALNCECYTKLYQEPVSVGVTKRDLQIIEEMQTALKDRIAMKGIVVEMNPSSNIEICEINCLREHQAFVLDHIKSTEENPIIINVNSDDPVVFQTNVANEMAYLYYGLLERGVGREESLLWINKLRQFGMDSSFIQQDKREYLEHVDMILDRLEG